MRKFGNIVLAACLLIAITVNYYINNKTSIIHVTVITFILSVILFAVSFLLLLRLFGISGQPNRVKNPLMVMLLLAVVPEKLRAFVNLSNEEDVFSSMFSFSSNWILPDYRIEECLNDCYNMSFFHINIIPIVLIGDILIILAIFFNNKRIIFAALITLTAIVLLSPGNLPLYALAFPALVITLKHKLYSDASQVIDKDVGPCFPRKALASWVITIMAFVGIWQIVQLIYHRISSAEDAVLPKGISFKLMLHYDTVQLSILAGLMLVGILITIRYIKKPSSFDIIYLLVLTSFGVFFHYPIIFFTLIYLFYVDFVEGSVKCGIVPKVRITRM